MGSPIWRRLAKFFASLLFLRLSASSYDFISPICRFSLSFPCNLCSARGCIGSYDLVACVTKILLLINSLNGNLNLYVNSPSVKVRLSNTNFSNNLFSSRLLDLSKIFPACVAISNNPKIVSPKFLMHFYNYLVHFLTI